VHAVLGGTDVVQLFLLVSYIHFYTTSYTLAQVRDVTLYNAEQVTAPPRLSIRTH
jgi:hypothetical protein